MEISINDTTGRQALLSVLLASLIVTAGCAGILSDGGDSGGGATPTPTSGESGGDTAANGTDLRSVSIPDNGSVTASGELDRGDPTNGSKYYEPIQVAAAEGDTVNISVETEGGSPELRVINPDGNVSATVSNVSGNDTGFTFSTFGQTGRYTLEATSVSENATFNYTLTIERAERGGELFGGPMEQWNETEQYLEFSQDFTSVTAETSDYGSFSTNVSLDYVQANASGDYAIITYGIHPDLNFTQTNEIDVNFRLAYKNLYQSYSKFGDNSSMAENETWAPEIIFFRGVNQETGELHRTTFLTLEWAKQYAEDDDNDVYAGWYYSTLRYGPGNQYYDPETGVTYETFPQNYWNYTYPADNSTLAERYGL